MTGFQDHNFEDIYLGRIGRRFLSVDITLAATHTSQWSGRVIWYPGGTRSTYRGPFVMLRLQSRIRWFALSRAPIRYEEGLDLDRWRTDEWVRAPHVHPHDLTRLQQIADEYSRNVVTVDASHSPTNEVLLIPTAVITEIEHLAQRLTPPDWLDNSMIETVAGETLRVP